MFNIVGNLIGSVVGTVGDVVKKDQAIKEMEKQSKADLAKAKLQAKIEEQKVNSQLKIAKVQAQINHQTRVFDGDNAYDLMVLEQNKYSYMDEMLKFSIIGLDGYIIFKYGIEGLSNLPTWLQLANIMVLVSTLGGKGILRMFLNGGLKGLVKKKR
jgi:hypothetical protein